MTNKEAASIIESLMNNFTRMGRGNGKSTMIYRCIEAFCKAIELLRNTPDEEVT